MPMASLIEGSQRREAAARRGHEAAARREGPPGRRRHASLSRLSSIRLTSGPPR